MDFLTGGLTEVSAEDEVDLATERVPVNYALTDIVGVMEVANALGVGHPWTSANVADVMELVLAGWDEIQADIAREGEADAAAATLAALADCGALEAIMEAHRQGTPIRDVQATYGLSDGEWLAVWCAPSGNGLARWETLSGLSCDDLLEFERMVRDGATTAQLCARFTTDKANVRQTATRMGLEKLLAGNNGRWSKAAEADFAIWCDEGVDATTLAHRLWTHHQVRATRDTVSRRRAAIGKPARRQITAAEVAEANRLHADGLTWKEVAVTLKVNQRSLWNAVNRNKINAKAVKDDADLVVAS